MQPERLHSADPSRLLTWLPAPPAEWRTLLASRTWSALLQLSRTQMDFIAIAKVERALDVILKDVDAVPEHLVPMRLALLASSTTKHLVPSMRIAALRRGILLTVHECGYGQYMQELASPDSPLAAFAPNVILFALDAHHLADLATSGADPLDRLRDAWRMARTRFNATVIQQTALPVFPALLGSNEHRYPASPLRILTTLNEKLREAADAEGIHLLAIDQAAAQDGLSVWYDAAMWFRAKQEIHPSAAPLYGEVLAPLLASLAGRMSKCLVLDLDNTLWGGVIGDDGIEGILLGQGHAAGEAFLDFQRYCLHLRERGILLAVCSKNEEAVALNAFEQHPSMLLKREHFAAFVANWDDKATNLRHIARTLQIGTDALVFVDDNPFERELVRRELPEVALPEMQEDPATFAATVARAGYFESLGLTAEDLARASAYQANAAREQMRESSTDLEGYLRSLRMVLRHREFDEANLPRLVQLIGKTNQFNLTTRRHSAEDVRTIMGNSCCITAQLALTDAFGDNGTIALLIARARNSGDLHIDMWLMSCRVLGRRVEEATLSLLVEMARVRGFSRILGEMRPTPKNTIVRDLYRRLGFTAIEAPADAETGSEWFALDLAHYTPPTLPMEIVEG